MKPTGTIPYFLAAPRSLVRALSRAASSSNATWLKRARAFRTCDSSLIGSRRRPRASTYAKALFGSRARFLELSWLMAVRFVLPCDPSRITSTIPDPGTRRQGAGRHRRAPDRRVQEGRSVNWGLGDRVAGSQPSHSFPRAGAG